jgi:hypothetical protein
MKKTFSIPSSIEIAYEGCNHDLHNCYSFSQLEFYCKGKSLRIHFDADAAYVKNTSPKSIIIQFDMVDYFQISPDFVNQITPDFEELGYKNPDDMDIDWLLQEEESSPDDHLMFAFSGGAYLRVHSQYADITLT